MTYDEALNYIHSRPRLKNADGHAGMRKLMDYLGNPQDDLRYIHIAGTNGKGSCAAMCANVLKTAGYKTGLNISPFVIDFTERFSINGKYIPNDTLAEITEKVKFYRDKIEKENGLIILEFEIVTAIAFYWFAAEKCDIVCLEVGIGGLMDSTNIIKTSLVSCIMNISYDHQNILGDTLEEIAYQKAGIIKPGQDVVCYPAQDKFALDVIKKVAAEKNTTLIVPNKNDIIHINEGFMQTKLIYENFEIHQSFTGLHQSYNASVVIEAMKAVRKYGFNITDDNIVKGIENTKFPARIEVISQDPLIILDGGHNTDGVSALTAVLKENNIKNLTAVWRTLSDKQPEKIIEMIAPYVKTLYTVTLEGNKRALTARQLAEMAKGKIKTVYVAQSTKEAVDLAKENISGGLLVFGSLYLASEARGLLLK